MGIQSRFDEVSCECAGKFETSGAEFGRTELTDGAFLQTLQRSLSGIRMTRLEVLWRPTV